MVTVESLANGLPVIVPLYTGAAEIVDNDTLGIRFEPGNSMSLCEAIKNFNQLLKIPKIELMAKAAKFHLSNQVNQLICVYQVIHGEQ
jgi:glycosyltransferase involved in cell wall biosynthesis